MFFTRQKTRLKTLKKIFLLKMPSVKIIDPLKRKFIVAELQKSKKNINQNFLLKILDDPEMGSLIDSYISKKQIMKSEMLKEIFTLAVVNLDPINDHISQDFISDIISVESESLLNEIEKFNNMKEEIMRKKKVAIDGMEAKESLLNRETEEDRQYLQSMVEKGEVRRSQHKSDCSCNQCIKIFLAYSPLHV